jgi:hypothetical protein
MIVLKKLLPVWYIVITLSVLSVFFPASAHAASYTTSPQDNLGLAISKLKPGDVLQLKSGTYTGSFYVSSSIQGTADKPITIQPELGANVVIDGSGRSEFTAQIAGSHIQIKNMTFQGSPTSSCLRVQGSNISLSNLMVKDCHQHGVLIQGKQIVMENSTITNAARENEATPHTHWGSGLKVSVGADGVSLKNNKVFYNWGEGVAITRGRNVAVESNHIYDNFSANLYIDNSSQIKADDNFITCKPGSGFERDGRQANGLMISEESYTDWGSQLRDLTITNNIVAYCHRGVSYYSAEVSNAGLRTSNISNNILWDSVDYSLYIGDFPETNGTTISNNIVQHDAGKVAKIITARGLTFSSNTWLGGNPPELAKSSSDQYTKPSWLSQPGYTRESFGETPTIINPTPTPSPSTSPSIVPVPSASPSPIASPSPSPSTSPLPTIEPIPSPSITPLPSIFPSPILLPSPSPAPSPSPTPIVSPSPTPTIEPLPTPIKKNRKTPKQWLTAVLHFINPAE